MQAAAQSQKVCQVAVISTASFGTKIGQKRETQRGGYSVDAISKKEGPSKIFLNFTGDGDTHIPTPQDRLIVPVATPIIQTTRSVDERGSCLPEKLEKFLRNP